MTEPQENAVAKPPAVSFGMGTGLVPTDLEGLHRVANMLAQSGLAPKGMTSPPAIMTAMAMGAEVGLTPMQAIQCIAVVNGRPSIFGDAAIGLVSASGKLEDHYEGSVGEPGTDSYGWSCRVLRKGRSEPTERMFTVAHAKQAGLWGKSGPWSQYPDRMLQMRARSWALRDTFADVLRGLAIGEEQQDVELEPGRDYTVRTSKPSAADPEPVEVSLDPLARPDDPEFD